MFSEIARLLKKQGSLSVYELALTLKMDISALLPMLDLLEKKGRVKKLALPCGGGCASCNCGDKNKMTYYAAT